MYSMNFFLMSAFLTLTFATLCTGYKLSPPRSGPLRLKNGRDVSPGQLAYVVRIELAATSLTNEGPVLKYYNFCTGSVLTPTATLTAGHCYEEEYQTSGIAKHVVRYGSTPGKPDNQLDKFSDVLNITKPPATWGMDHPLFSNDLAIYTTEPIQLKSYGKISSLDYPSLFGLRVTVMGYGDINYVDQYTDTDTLALKLPLQIIDGMMVKCDEKGVDDDKFPLLCAKSACGVPQGALGPGDSGGPVVHATGIVGVSSMGFTEALRDNPENIPPLSQAYIVAISPYIDWLTRTFEQKNMS